MKQQTQDKAPAAPSTNIGEDKFTGGQWETEFCLDGSIFINSGEECICFMQGEEGEGITPKMEANAALIAAAPDMYKAMQGFIDNVITDKKLYDNQISYYKGLFRKVLAKANPLKQ